MERFKVPKFLERETKIFGFLTFRQIVFLAGVGVMLLILYYVVPRGIFFLLVIFGGGGSFALLFLQIEGMSLWHYLTQSFLFFFSSKKYFWEKKTVSPSVIKIKKTPAKKGQEPQSLKIIPEGHLEKLSSKIDMGFK